MPIMSKNQKYLVMLALLAGAAPAAVVAQDQAQDAPPADVSASVAMPAAELTEGARDQGHHLRAQRRPDAGDRRRRQQERHHHQ